MQLINNKPAIEFWHSTYKGIHLEYEESKVISSDDECLLQTFTV